MRDRHEIGKLSNGEEDAESGSQQGRDVVVDQLPLQLAESGEQVEGVVDHLDEAGREEHEENGAEATVDAVHELRDGQVALLPVHEDAAARPALNDKALLLVLKNGIQDVLYLATERTQRQSGQPGKVDVKQGPAQRVDGKESRCCRVPERMIVITNRLLFNDTPHDRAHDANRFLHLHLYNSISKHHNENEKWM